MTPQENRKFAKLATTIRGVILMLGYAVDDIERGRWNPDELKTLANGMDKLAEELRGGAAIDRAGGIVIDSVRADR